MDELSVRAVFRIPLPHDGYGEIRAGHLLNGGQLPLPPRAAVVLEVGAGYWCRRSELEAIARSLHGARVISVSGTDMRQGGRHDDSVITGLTQIADALHELCTRPHLFEMA